MTQTEKDLCETAQVIGGLVGCNGNYQRALARRIEQTGKTVGELTVAELIELDREEGKRFNQALGKPKQVGEAHG